MKIKLFFSVFIAALAIGIITLVILNSWEGVKTNFVNSEGTALQNEEPIILESKNEYAVSENEDKITNTETIKETREIIPSETKLIFAGDILLDDTYAIMSFYKQRGAVLEHSIDPKILAIMRGADICVVNNEFTYTLRGVPTPEKTYTFRANPENVSILKDMGVDVVSLANNHSYDYGEISLLDTLDTIDSAGIKRIGAGRSLDEASEILYITSNGIKIALLAATQIERLNNPDTKGATSTTPGVFRCFNPDLLEERLTQAKENSDFVILFVHWGTENTAELDWLQTSHALKYVKAGADLIVGAHPHCLQGVGYTENVPVVYSLGNFWFSSKTVDTALLEVKLSVHKTKVNAELRLIPASQENSGVRLLEDMEGEAVLAYIRGLSPEATIDTAGNISLK